LWFVKVDTVDADDISSEWVKGDYGGYDPSASSVSSYRFKLEGNNDRNLFLYRMDSLTAPTYATYDTADDFKFGVDLLGDHGNSYITVDYTPATADNLAGGHCLTVWQVRSTPPPLALGLPPCVRPMYFSTAACQHTSEPIEIGGSLADTPCRPQVVRKPTFLCNPGQRVGSSWYF